MKILAFGDIHEHCEHIKDIEDIDTATCIIITGDLTNVGGKEEARTVIEEARRYNPSVYAQAGNFDRREVETFLIQEGISLHGNGFKIEDIGIFGVGGSNKTPFATPNEFDEGEIKAFIHEGTKTSLFQTLKVRTRDLYLGLRRTKVCIVHKKFRKDAAEGQGKRRAMIQCRGISNHNLIG